MLSSLWEQFRNLLGLQVDVADVGLVQMVLRSIIVYVCALVVVRLASTRFMSRASAFDVIVGIMLGSVMGRAINGSAPFFPTLLAGAALVGVHWLLARLAYHFGWLGPLVKGKPVLLIRNGNVDRRGMRRGSITDHDLAEAMRLHSRESDPAKIGRAYLERDGSISVVPSRREPRVLDVAVEDGVQTVRIELR